MKQKRSRFLVIGLVAYLVFLPTMLPAIHLFNWFKLADTGVSLENISGTAWAGHVRTLRYKELELDKVRWQFQPLQLLLGRLEYRVKASGTDSRGVAQVGRPLFGDLYVREARCAVSATDVNPLLPGKFVQLGGTLQLDLSEATFRGGPVNVEGELIWNDAAIVEPVSMLLGGLQLQLISSDDSINGTLTDLSANGPLDVQGDLSLNLDGVYQIAGTIKPRASLSPEVRRVLPFLGLPDGEGRYNIDFSGTL